MTLGWGDEPWGTGPWGGGAEGGPGGGGGENPPPTEPPIVVFGDTIAVQAVLEIAYEDLDLDPVWVDESAYLRSFSFTRGRSNELDTTQAATFTAVLDNRTRRFDPTSPDTGGEVRPMRRIRLRARPERATTAAFAMRRSTLRGGAAIRGGNGSIEIPLFYGYAEGWPESYQDYPDATVSLRAVDGFKILGLVDFESIVIIPSAVYENEPEELSGSRVGHVLDRIGWQGERAIETGVVYIQSEAFEAASEGSSGTKALSHLLDVEFAEGGLFFMDRDGRVRFFASDHSFVEGPVYGNRFFAELPWRADGVALDYDDSQLWNSVTLSNALTSVTDTDAPSIDRYFERDYSKDTVISRTAQMQDRVFTLLERFSEPALRASSIAPLAKTATEWDRMLGRELWDLLTVRIRPPAGGIIDQPSRIEGISMSAEDKRNWKVTWQVTGLGDPTPRRLFYTGASLADLSASDPDGYDAFLEEDPVGATEKDLFFPAHTSILSCAFTRPGVISAQTPGPKTWSVRFVWGYHVEVTTAIQIHRVTNAGVVQASSPVSEASLGVPIDDPNDPETALLNRHRVNVAFHELDLGTFAATDRIRVDYTMANPFALGATATIFLGTGNDEVDTPLA